MTLHLIKLAVGIEDIDDLLRRQRLNKRGNVEHRTRMTPTRAKELLDGGSMYWVVCGFIQARRALVGFHQETDANGRRRCVIEMEPKVVPVRPTARRPFQGWRYLKASDAPEDMKAGAKRPRIDPDMPKEMRRELMKLGLL